jgi:hypothetical protein
MNYHRLYGETRDEKLTPVVWRARMCARRPQVFLLGGKRARGGCEKEQYPFFARLK